MTNERLMARNNPPFPSYIKWKAQIEDAVVAMALSSGLVIKNIDTIPFDYLSRYKDKVSVAQASQDLLKVAKEENQP